MPRPYIAVGVAVVAGLAVLLLLAGPFTRHEQDNRVGGSCGIYYQVSSVGVVTILSLSSDSTFYYAYHPNNVRSHLGHWIAHKEHGLTLHFTHDVTHSGVLEDKDPAEAHLRWISEDAVVLELEGDPPRPVLLRKWCADG